MTKLFVECWEKFFSSTLFFDDLHGQGNKMLLILLSNPLFVPQPTYVNLWGQSSGELDEKSFKSKNDLDRNLFSASLLAFILTPRRLFVISKNGKILFSELCWNMMKFVCFFSQCLRHSWHFINHATSLSGILNVQWIDIPNAPQGMAWHCKGWTIWCWRSQLSEIIFF